jgi:galactokinase
MIQVKAPARICFFGDHQDYLDLPVIAGTINRYIYIEGTPNSTTNLFLQFIDIDKDMSIDLNEQLNTIHNEDYIRSVLVVLRKQGFHFTQGYDIKIWGDIPINAGVSSSSALVVAWIRFLLTATNQDQDISDIQIGQWAYEAEVTYFNQPGGLMDQYTIAQGGLLYIDTLKAETQRLRADFGSLVIAESGIAKQTLTVLQNAKTYGRAAIAEVQKNVPNFNMQEAGEEAYKEYLKYVSKPYQAHWYAAVYNFVLTQNAKAMLSSSTTDHVTLGKWMNAHQVILQERIQNTPEVMQKQIKAALQAGALGAKIIGSGGGGCMVAMVSEATKEKVILAFLKAGAKKAYEITLTNNE